MFEYKKLMERYRNDAPFNRIVNVHINLLREFGFTPDEIRQASFLAQYMYEMAHATMIIQSERDLEQAAKACAILQQAVLDIEDLTKFPAPKDSHEEA